MSWFYLCECALSQGWADEYTVWEYILKERWQFGAGEEFHSQQRTIVSDGNNIIYDTLIRLFIQQQICTANSPSQTHTNWYRNPPLFRLTKLNTLWLWIVISNARFFLASSSGVVYTYYFSSFPNPTPLCWISASCANVFRYQLYPIWCIYIYLYITIIIITRLIRYTLWN